MKGNIDAVHDFIFEGGDVNEMVEIPPQFPARFFESFHGFPEVTLLVLWALGPHKTTLLHLSIVNLQPAITTILLEEGANINATDQSGRTPLIEAVMLLPITRLERTYWANQIGNLFNRQLRKEISKEAFGKIAHLHSTFHAMTSQAVRRICFGSILHTQEMMVEGLENTITRLIAAKGIDVNKTTEMGENPLCEAIKNGERDVVEQLIQAGANPFVKINSITPRELAKEYASDSGNPVLFNDIYEIVKSSPVQPPPRPYSEQATRRLGMLYHHLMGGP